MLVHLTEFMCRTHKIAIKDKVIEEITNLKTESVETCFWSFLASNVGHEKLSGIAENNFIFSLALHKNFWIPCLVILL